MEIDGQIFVRIRKKDHEPYHKDINQTTPEEREAWYHSLSKGQLMHMLELVGKFNKK